MRNMCFRVWDTFENTWEDPQLFMITGDGRLLKRLKHDEFEYCNTQYNISFSTKLKDTNDKDIYEMDIIKVDWGIVPVSQRDIFKPQFIMEWRNYGWFPFTHVLPMPKDIEVIGNIYENPELLEGREK